MKKNNARPFHHTEGIIENKQQLEKLVTQLSQAKIIAIDTEFLREKTFFPIVALIQVATDAESWLIDPIALGKEGLLPFLKLMENPDILKVFHAAQADQECLYTSYGVLATPCFDTAIAGALTGYGESPGLAKLTKEILKVSLEKGHARTDWTTRPLQSQLCKYAHQDVTYLIELYEKLKEKLDHRRRYAWALELSKKYEDPRTYAPHPEDVARKLIKTRNIDKRGYAVLMELVQWREKRVRELNLPRKWVADDDVIVALSNVRPKDRDHLSAFRGLNKGEQKNSANDILQAIHRGMTHPEHALAHVPIFESPEKNEERAVEVLQCFLKILADENEIAPRYLISQEGLLEILRNPAKNLNELVSQQTLARGAADLIGDKLLDFVHGKLAFRLSGSNVKIDHV